MSIIDKIRALFGRGDPTPPADDDPTVRVEHDPAADPDATTEAAVKGAETSGSTGTAGGGAPTDAEPTTEADEDAHGTETGDDDETTADDATGESVETIKGIGPTYAERLGEAGVETVADLADADAGELAESTGISASRVESWVERARE